MSEIDSMVYYDWDRVYSYNRKWNLILTPRGYGKTFGFRKGALNAFRKRKELFTEIVRVKDELLPVASKYFAKVQAKGFFPYYDFKYEMKERTMYARDGRFENASWQPIGYIVAMTEEQFLKKLTFTDGNHVSRMALDEAVIEKKDRFHRYNKREWEIINGIISTITRETPDNPWRGRMYFFGNAVDLTCPLFEALGIDRVPSEYGYHLYGDDVLLHYAEPVNREAFERMTTSGRALSGSTEGDKLFGNVFEGSDSNLHIAHKPKQAKFWRGYAYLGRVFGLWIDHAGGLVHVTDGAPRNQEVLALTYEDGTINYRLVRLNSRDVKILGDLFYKRLLRFEDIQTRERFADMCMTLGIV